MRLYNLTPLGPGWGWGSRILEIAGQTVSILVSPVFTLARWVGNALERFVL